MNNTLMIINILSVTYYSFTGIVFIFILLGIIGKFGLFPLNLGIFGIVDLMICGHIESSLLTCHYTTFYHVAIHRVAKD